MDKRVSGFSVSIFRVKGSNYKLYTKFSEGFVPTGRCPKDRGVFSMFESYRVTALRLRSV